MQSTLPVPYDRPIANIVTYQNNQPPAVPNIQVHPQAVQLVVPAAAVGASIAGQSAQESFVKMFCFNVLASGNWHNEFFAEYVKMICDFSILKQRQNPANNPFYQLQETAKEVLNLFASTIALQFGELLQILGPNLLGPLQHNAKLYNDLKMSCGALYSQTMIPPMQQMGGMQMGGTPHHFHHQSAPANPISAAAVTTFGRNSTSQDNTPFNKFSGGSSRIERITRDPAPRSAPVQTQVTQVEPTASYQPQMGKVVFNDNVTGEEEMSLEKHQIFYKGLTFAIQQAPIQKQMEAAVKQVEETAISEQDPSIEEGEPFTNRCLDSAIQVMRGTLSENIDESIKVYMNEAEIVTPIISSIALGNIFVEMSQCKNFTALAGILKQHVTTMSKKDPVSFKLTRAWVSELDRYLTKLVNDFLAYSTPWPGFGSITSFIEDVEELPGVLVRKYDSKVNTGWGAFQRNVMSCFFSCIRDSGSLIMPELEQDNPAVDFDIVTVRYGVYYITANSDELGYTITKEPKRVSVETTPMLHRLLKSIFYRNRLKNLPCHVLVTLDGVKYSIYESATGDGVFTIIED